MPKHENIDETSHQLDVISPAIKVGAIAGASGMLVGAFAGIIRSTSPILFSLASGVQCFTLGSTITGFRAIVGHLWPKNNSIEHEKVLISTIAGALGGGSSGAILRGRRNVIPGAVMFAIFGAIGQALTDKISNRDLNLIAPNPEPKVSWLNSRWSPAKTISNEEYENIMSEKLLQIRAEIALVDDRIKNLKTENRPDYVMKVATENDAT